MISETLTKQTPFPLHRAYYTLVPWHHASFITVHSVFHNECVHMVLCECILVRLHMHLLTTSS